MSCFFSSTEDEVGGVSTMVGDVSVREVVEIFEVLPLDGTQGKFLVPTPVTGRARPVSFLSSFATLSVQRCSLLLVPLL
jgi:hypothetical protein